MDGYVHYLVIKLQVIYPMLYICCFVRKLLEVFYFLNELSYHTHVFCYIFLFQTQTPPDLFCSLGKAVLVFKVLCEGDGVIAVASPDDIRVFITAVWPHGGLDWTKFISINETANLLAWKGPSSSSFVLTAYLLLHFNSWFAIICCGLLAWEALWLETQHYCWW